MVPRSLRRRAVRPEPRARRQLARRSGGASTVRGLSLCRPVRSLHPGAHAGRTAASPLRGLPRLQGTSCLPGHTSRSAVRGRRAGVRAVSVLAGAFGRPVRARTFGQPRPVGEDDAPPVQWRRWSRRARPARALRPQVPGPKGVAGLAWILAPAGFTAIHGPILTRWRAAAMAVSGRGREVDAGDPRRPWPPRMGRGDAGALSGGGSAVATIRPSPRSSPAAEPGLFRDAPACPVFRVVQGGPADQPRVRCIVISQAGPAPGGRSSIRA